MPPPPPPPPPLPASISMMKPSSRLCENIHIKTLQDIQGRAKTVRIGKVRWPPPLKDSETFESELQRRLELQRRIQEEIQALNQALMNGYGHPGDDDEDDEEEDSSLTSSLKQDREALKIALNVN